MDNFLLSCIFKLKNEIMKIYVCVKQVPDTAASIQIIEGNRIDERMTFIINPYDEHCLTEAAKIRDAQPGSEVVAVSLGNVSVQESLRSALAMGADRSIHIQSDARHDSLETARILKAAIEQDGKPDLILTGREAIDSGGMQTMFRIGALLQIPVLSNAVNIDIQNGKAFVSTEAELGSRLQYSLNLPCIIGAGRGLNTPRYPTFPDIMKARKKEIRTLDLQDLRFEPSANSMELLELRTVAEDRTPRPIEGDADTAVEELIRILEQEARVI